MSKTTRRLIISQGIIKDDDGSWDINYWLRLTPSERLTEARLLAENYHLFHEKKSFSLSINKAIVSSGKINSTSRQDV